MAPGAHSSGLCPPLQVTRLEGQVLRYRAAAESAEKVEDELKAEKRKLQREVLVSAPRDPLREQRWRHYSPCHPPVAATGFRLGHVVRESAVVGGSVPAWGPFSENSRGPAREDGWAWPGHLPRTVRCWDPVQGRHVGSASTSQEVESEVALGCL